MMGIQTLHSHTITSDGVLTHQEILDCAKENNISVVAFTDHDSLIDKTFDLLKKKTKLFLIGLVE